ncbi:MAG TPA: glycosyltransferase family 39 protein, partial [Anaerolineae bacterium]|nr:glycosyltransferase family 39 protein [Anaerolineae bacterium]
MSKIVKVARSRDVLLALLVGLVALIPRLIGLNVFLTADEPKSWFGRSIIFLDALARADWAATFDSPAPGVTTMWAGSIGLLLEYARQGFPGNLTDFLAVIPFDPLDPSILPLIRLPIVLLATLTAVLTFWWGRAVFGRPAALLAALLIALDPFTLALTRILGHDGPVTLFMWLSLLAFLRALPAA